MTTLKVRFDGRVLIPETPLDLPQNQILEIHVEEAAPRAAAPLASLADWAQQLSGSADLPTDGAAQHDHYLYGTPKN